MKLSKYNIDLLIQAMDLVGFYFDDFSSYESYICFRYPGGCLPLSFETWGGVYEYLAGLVIEDLDTAADVYRLLDKIET